MSKRLPRASRSNRGLEPPQTIASNSNSRGISVSSVERGGDKVRMDETSITHRGCKDEPSEQGQGCAEISQRETKLVRRTLCLYVSILAVIYTTVGIIAYQVLRDVDENNFDSVFDEFARQVIDVAQVNAKNIYDRYRAMGLQLTALGMAGNSSSWPFVQMPHFEAQTAETQRATGAAHMTFAPLVRRDQRADYEAYSLNHRDWIQESLAYLGVGANTSELHVSPKIFSSASPVSSLPFHLPIAQISSVHELSRLINSDLMAFGQHSMDMFNRLNTTRSGVMTQINRQDVKPLTVYVHPSNVPEEVPQPQPGSFMSAPIFESFDPDSAIVGIFSGFLFWGKNFEKLLPDGTKPLLLVVGNCDESITFVIEGRKATFLAFGDGLHDAKFDSLARSGILASYQTPLGCGFSITIYPTLEFYENYLTNGALVKTVSLVSCFVITALVFIVYNVAVEHRQKKVFTTAKESSLLVGSLFPETVRRRLIKYAEQENDSKQASAQLDSDEVGGLLSKPIADHFEGATVMFADLVGFTKWSSSRQPEHVFTLLETLYNAFDRIARQMDVFKVETIGDSYLAVAGLPKVRDDHAQVMVEFAMACLSRMQDLLPGLNDTFGDGTYDLAVRIGIHSGPVTAGVLRGEKNRFQLFGDTVNTASRMESTSLPGRIQVSTAVADELARLGSVRYLTRRKGVVIAKGKGEMETFWVENQTTA